MILKMLNFSQQFPVSILKLAASAPNFSIETGNCW